MLTNTVSWGLGPVVSAIALSIVAITTMSGTTTVNDSNMVIGMVGLMSCGLIGFVIGAVGGAITGVLLVWLLRHLIPQT